MKNRNCLKVVLLWKHMARAAFQDISFEAVWNKVRAIGWTRTSAGCLEYNGYRNQSGYGQIRAQHRGRLLRVHRLAYRMKVGPLTSADVILHKCDNPSCSEPSHLRRGTQAENMADMFNKGRDGKADLKVCPNGHKYPEDRPKLVDKNRCRVCARDRNRRYHLRKKALHGVA